MRSLSPVVWSEGMHLAHHHFQLRDRYFEDSSTFALSSLVFAPYGVTRVEFDNEALLNGVVRLVHAAGVMPDGLTFSFPEDDAPPQLDIRTVFSPTAESHSVLLMIPPYRRGAANCGEEERGPVAGVRYVANQLRVADETTGLDEKTLTVAKKNFALRLDVEEPGDAVVLPLARVRRDHAGNYVYDHRYIPPCLHVGASPRLMQLLQRLIEMMDAKAASLAHERGGAGGAEFAQDEIASFWLSHAIQSELPPLRHHLESRSVHPERLYKELVRLAGALCTFSLEARARDLPLYDHDDLTACFGALEEHIRTHLDVVLPKRALRVALEPMSQQFFFSGTVPDPRATEGAAWFLEAKVAGSHAAAITDVPRLVKVCSAKHIVRLVKTAHPAMKVEHTPSPPAEISPRLGAEYFRIETAGPCWRSIESARDGGEVVEVGVYAPEALSDLELAVLIVPGS